MRVEKIMTTAVVTASPQTPLKEIAELLAERRISGIPIVEDGIVVGVISESDIVRKEAADDTPRTGLFARRPRRGSRSPVSALTARDMMTAPPLTVEPWMSLRAAAWLMAEHDVNRLPVVERGRLMGIVARADLVRAFVRPDADLEREVVEEVLPSLSLSPLDIAVSVDHGVVSLDGELADERDVDALPHAVRHVAGVVDIRSRVHQHLEEGARR
jgi:CBS domain-containing protein